MRLDALLPQTLFGRTLAATVAVFALALLIIMLLFVRDRRELALAESGAGDVAANIAQVSEYFARLSRDERAEARSEFARKLELAIPPPLPPPPPLRGNPQIMERAFASALRDKLGAEFSVATGPPVAALTDVIVLNRSRGPRDFTDHPPPPGPGGGPPPPDHRLLDVTVRLPDGDSLIFRAQAPRPEPRIPARLFFQLGALMAALGIALFFMTRTITRPLAALERAAGELGSGVNVATLEERGTREVRSATRAFNSMQDRLRRYLDSRTRVLAAMSHDMRTPLTRLRLRVESINDESLRDRCVADIDEMSSMVRSALSVFRGLNDEEPRVAVDINALFEELQQQCAERERELTLGGRAHSPYVAKPLALRRCLNNLIDNALQYAQHCGVLIEDGRDLIIRIRDDGPGIPEEKLEQVFEPFYRIESSRNRDSGGTGLGLGIAREIAQAHGGSLTLRNRAEGGLEARLVLPRQQAT